MEHGGEALGYVGVTLFFALEIAEMVGSSVQCIELLRWLEAVFNALNC